MVQGRHYWLHCLSGLTIAMSSVTARQEKILENPEVPSFFPAHYCVALREKRVAGNESLKTGEEPSAHTVCTHIKHMHSHSTHSPALLTSILMQDADGQ